MSGYQEYSKSNNAVAAECASRFPATEAASRLGLSAGFVRDCCAFTNQGERHHVSKYYNEVPYYDTKLIQRWMEGDVDAIEEAGSTFADALASWRSALRTAAAMPVTVLSGVTVTWLEWGGTRTHPHAITRKASGCTITDKGGSFVQVTFPDGKVMKKGRMTTGFSVTRGDGTQVAL